jgi:hypothetical protein
MPSEEPLPLIDEVLEEWRTVIGDDYEGYRNHVVRVVRSCLALRDCGDEEREKVVIAGCFHDIGIWTGHTFDYIPPSLPPAMDYLERRGLERWSGEIELMITEHHKLTAYRDPGRPLVEVFRKGDLVDFSLGVFRSGLSRTRVDELKARYPNAGFHRNLVRLAARWFVRHPLDPLPMVKW